MQPTVKLKARPQRCRESRFGVVPSTIRPACRKEDAYQPSVKCPSLSRIAITYRFIEFFEVALPRRSSPELLTLQFVGESSSCCRIFLRLRFTSDSPYFDAGQVQP